MLRLYFDEDSMDHHVVLGLRRYGLDVITVFEGGRGRTAGSVIHLDRPSSRVGPQKLLSSDYGDLAKLMDASRYLTYAIGIKAAVNVVFVYL